MKSPTIKRQMADAQQTYERIAKKIRPFLPRRDQHRLPARGEWLRGVDMPTKSQERFRAGQ